MWFNFIKFIFGSFIGLFSMYFILPEKIENHGPDSSVVRQQTFYDDSGNKIKFEPTPIIPPIKMFI
jgi:hypothetical protein